MKYIIKKIEADAFDAIRNLRIDPLEKIELEDRYIRIQTGVDECYAVFIDDEIIADVTLTFKSSDTAAVIEDIRVYLSGLFVSEPYRNMKIATSLLEYVILELSKTKYCEISVLVDNQNLPACALYTKLGFEREKSYTVEEWTFDLMVYRIW